VTQPAFSGPFSCFSSSRRGSGERRAVEIDLSADDATDGYLASAITDRTGAGSSRCPWLLHASPWQRINVTLIDFSDSTAARPGAGTQTFGYSVVPGDTSDDAMETEQTGEERHHPAGNVDPRQHLDEELSDVREDDGQLQHTDTRGNELHELRLRTFCHKYAVVRERRWPTTSSRETVVCGDQAANGKVVYLSTGNVIEVELVRATSTDDDTDNNTPTRPPAVFLLRYDSQYLTRLVVSQIKLKRKKDVGAQC